MDRTPAAALRDDDAFVHLARHRTIYDVALAFYAVLAAFALDEPLKKLGSSLATSLTGRGLDDWTERLLILTLLMQSAVWLHALMVSVELSDTRNEEKGAKKRHYHQAIAGFWSGVVMVVILVTLGQAVDHGTKSFLTVSILYVTWSLLYSLIYLVIRHSSAEATKTHVTSFLSLPILYITGSLLYSLICLVIGHSSAKATKTRVNRIAVSNIRQCLALLLILAGLASWARHTPTQGLRPFLQALIWFVIVTTSVVWNYFFSEYYGL